MTQIRVASPESHTPEPKISLADELTNLNVPQHQDSEKGPQSNEQFTIPDGGLEAWATVVGA
jgi:hypothetical protein